MIASIVTRTHLLQRHLRPQEYVYTCFITESGELIVSRYVAESITTDAGCFSHVGLCQLRTKLLKLLAPMYSAPIYVGAVPKPFKYVRMYI